MSQHNQCVRCGNQFFADDPVDTVCEPCLGMKRWAVSYIDWFEHDLTTVIVQAETWQDALMLHPKIATFEWKTVPDLERFKMQAFDCDCMVECVEIT